MARTYLNLMAILFVFLTLTLMFTCTAGCSSIKMEREGSNEKITVRAPPKDFTNLDFHWHDTRLRAGEAATAEQPWADVIGDWGDMVINVLAYCKANPAECAQ